MGRDSLLDASPAQSSTRTPGCGAKPNGRGPRRPSGSRSSLAGCGSKSQGRPSPRSDPICASSAGRLGPSPQGWSALFSSLPGAEGGGEHKRSNGDGDVEKTLPVRSPPHPVSFPGVSLLLSLISALGEEGGLLLDLAESGGKRVQEEGPTTFPHLNP